MKKRLLLAVIYSGLAGIIMQVTLLRDLLIKFYSNELSVGIILSTWLLLESCGAFAANFFARKNKKVLKALILCLSIFYAFSVFTPIAVRFLNNIFGLSFGENMGYGF